jgi:hypothetical protein
MHQIFLMELLSCLTGKDTKNTWQTLQETKTTLQRALVTQRPSSVTRVYSMPRARSFDRGGDVTDLVRAHSADRDNVL